MPREPMLLYIAATNRVVSTVVVVEREEGGKTMQRSVYYLSEVLSTSKQNYPHYQKMTYGVYMAAKKLKHYFQEHSIRVVAEAPISEIISNKDASGRIAKWAIELSPYTPQYDKRDTIKSQVLADFFIDWAEIQYEPPLPDANYWRIHFDGSKAIHGLGAGIVLSSPKNDQLRYVLQIHFAASNNVAEYEALACSPGSERCSRCIVQAGIFQRFNPARPFFGASEEAINQALAGVIFHLCPAKPRGCGSNGDRCRSQVR
jgi:hypothetical protein